MSNIFYKTPQNLDDMHDMLVPFVLGEIRDEVYPETYRSVEENLNMFFWTLKMQGYQLIQP